MRLVLLLAIFAPSYAHAQLARMLADTMTEPTQSPLKAGPMVEMNGHLYFAGYRVFLDRTGFELWRTDGTAAELVRQLEDPYHYREQFPIAPSLTVSGDRVFAYTYSFGLISDGAALWASDGTAAGSARVMLLGTPERNPRFDGAGDPTLFQYYDDTSGFELWRTDGTAAGTSLLADLAPGAASSMPVAFTETAHGVLFFANGDHLYRSDGTAAGTVELTSISRGGLCSLGELGGRSIFSVQGAGLYETDGTAAGTVRVHDGSVAGGVQAGASIFYFADGVDPGLWIYDGATARQIPGVLPQAGDSAVSDERVFFFGLDGMLWVSDGTDLGTVALGSVTNGRDLNPITGGVAFVTDSGIYTSDGTTVSILASDVPLDLASLGGALFYFAEQELIRISGTSVLVVEDFSTQQTDLSRFEGAYVGGAMLLHTTPQWIGPGTGRSIWSSDGTPEGTDLGLTLDDPGQSFYHDMAEVVGRALLLKIGFDVPGFELISTDGTLQGTTSVFSFSGTQELIDLVGDGRRQYISSKTNGSWITDGTSAGTFELIPDAIAIVASSANLSFILGAATLDEQVAMTEFRLYQTDGTIAGTTVVHTVMGPVGGPHGLAVADGRATYVLDGKLYEAGGRVATPRELVGEGVRRGPVMVGTKAFFSTANALSIVDEAGTVQEVAAISAEFLTALGDRLVFSGYRPEEGAELWISDGTSAGTYAVDIHPGVEGSIPSGFIVVGQHAIFVANDGVHGRELWVTDGTASGTRLLDDTIPGPDGLPDHAFDPHFVLGGDHVYFLGYSVDHHLEPWAIPISAITCPDGCPATPMMSEPSTPIATEPPPEEESSGCTAIADESPLSLILVALFFAFSRDRTKRGAKRANASRRVDADP